MKRPIALLAGALVAAGLIVAPAPSALAESTIISGEGWSMTLWIPSPSWSDLITTNFLLCNELPISLRVAAPEDVEWSLAGQVSAAGSTVPLETFALSGKGPNIVPISIPGILMCEHFGASSEPPEHAYLATGTATFTGSPPALPFDLPFTIEPMRSSAQWRTHEIRDGVSAILGQVVAFTNDGFKRPAPIGTVTLERLEGSTWLKAGEAMSAADGNFVVLAGSVLPTGSYFRLRYTGDYWVAAHLGMPVEVWPPFTPLPLPTPTPITSPTPRFPSR